MPIVKDALAVDAVLLVQELCGLIGGGDVSVHAV